MEIERKGANCVTLKVGAVNVVVDPKLSLYKQKDAKVDGAIEIVTADEFAVEASEKILINGAGEYEVSNVSIHAFAAQRYTDEKEVHHATMYRLVLAGYRVAIVGHVAAELSEAQLEALSVVDILVIPVGGGGYTLDGQAAANVTRQIDPKIVIPTHYKEPGITYGVEQETVDTFLSAMAAGEHETTTKLKLKSGIGLPEVLKIVELTRPAA